MSSNAGWSITTLGECATWFSGGTPSTSKPEYWNGETPWIGSGSLTSFYIRDSERRVTPAGLENGTRLVPKDTVIFVVRGMSLKTEFRVGITKRPVAFGQDCKALIAKPVILPEFLADALRAKAPEILSMVEEAGHGTGTLQTDRMKALAVPLPSLDEQRQVVSLVGAFDRLTELLHQTNHTLEAIAQAIFRSWFIDFDPVRAKAQGREPEEMDAETAALFPSEFEDSPVGRIPRGWQVKSLDNIANYLNGLALQKYPASNAEDYLPVIKIAQLRAGNAVGADRASTELPPEYVCHDGDVLFSWSGSLEVELWCGGMGALNQHLFRVLPEAAPKWFCYLATKHHLPMFREIAAGKATTMGHIQRKHLTEARVAVPPTALLGRANEVFEPILERRVVASVCSRSLAEIRDLLLPRLMSGQLSVPEAEDTIEEALA